MNVSVVIPAYNEEQFIRPCLEALAQQTDQPDEVIVVDNNCTDKTIDIAKEFPVRIVAETRQGISYARNAGFDAAQGDIIARCDADTVPPPDWIRKIKADFADPSVDALTGPCVFYDFPFQRPVQRAHVIAYFRASRVLFGHNTLFGCNMAIRAACWKKIRSNLCMNNDKVHEDIDLAIHIADAGGRILFDRDLISATSGRRVHATVPSLAKYLFKWPGTKYYHRKNVLR